MFVNVLFEISSGKIVKSQWLKWTITWNFNMEWESKYSFLCEFYLKTKTSSSSSYALCTCMIVMQISHKCCKLTVHQSASTKVTIYDRSLEGEHESKVWTDQKSVKLHCYTECECYNLSWIYEDWNDSNESWTDSDCHTTLTERQVQYQN